MDKVFSDLGIQYCKHINDIIYGMYDIWWKTVFEQVGVDLN